MKMTHLIPQRALVVEDDVWMKPVITLALKSALSDIVIDWVGTAEEALKKTQANHYDLIIADIYLNPGSETGLGLWYRWQNACPETPVLLTSSIPVDIFAKSVSSQDSGPYYLPKPFNIDQCKHAIEGLVSSIEICS